MTYTAQAYAKINLFLSVGETEGNRHLVDTVMQSVSLADTLSFTPREEGTVRLLCDNEDLSTTDNLAFKAAEAYETAAGITVRGDLVIRKEIPIAAGLGGGSADAAATLLLLNRAYRALSDEKLAAVAETLGTDVPFFLTGGAALCTHYGEKITPIPACPACTVVLAKPCRKPSTATMYRLLDAVDLPPHVGKASAMEQALNEGNMKKIAAAAVNDFEFVWHNDAMEQVRATMEAGGALTARLSGSGPVIFGLFDAPDKAARCLSSLQFAGIEATSCQPVSCGVKLS